MKKLPAIFRKSYKEKAFNKKILKKLYIPEDKKYIESLFKQTTNANSKKGEKVYEINKDKVFTTKELARLSALAKQIKKHSGSIRIIPLIACILIISLFVVTVGLTRNLIAHKVITTACEKIFQAKCDIEKVNISFFKSYITIKNFAIADKDNPMKNLFSANEITTDFNLTELLKGKFVAEDLKALGLAVGSVRTESGELKQYTKENEEHSSDSKTSDSSNENSINNKATEVLEQTKQSLGGVFNQYNPEVIIQNCYSNLQTPTTVDSTTKELNRIIPLWKDKPAEISSKINELQTTANAVASINLDAIKTDPVKIKDAIITINSAISQAQNLKTETEETITNIKSDATTVKQLSVSLKDAINHDIKLADKEIAKIKSFSIEDGKHFITGTLEAASYNVFGDYYPYIKKIVSFLKEKKTEKPTKVKKATVIRAEGRTVLFKKSTFPAFYIANTEVSGESVLLTAKDITNDMNITGKPITVTLKIGFPFDFNASKLVSFSGVPVFKSDTTLSLNAIINTNKTDITGNAFFSNLNITAEPFEPVFASNLYSKTLARITSMDMNINALYTNDNGINIKLTSDADRQFANALQTQMNEELNNVKSSAKEAISQKISELSGGAITEINNFNDIQSKLNSYKSDVTNITKSFEARKEEMESALKAQASNTILNKVDSFKKLF